MSENTIYKVDLTQDVLHILKSMESKFSKAELEKYLTVAYSYGKGIEIEYNDYEIVFGTKMKPLQEIYIEKISQDNSLYIKVGVSLSNVEYEFLKAKNMNTVLILNDELKIEIVSINIEYLDETVNDVVKIIMKYYKELKNRAELYIDGNFIILQEKLAKIFVTKELLQLASKYKIIGTHNLKKYNIKAVKPKIVGSFRHKIDFLEGDVELDIEGEKFSISDVLNSFKKDSYIILSDGTNALINRKYMEKLERVFKGQGKRNESIV